MASIRSIFSTDELEIIHQGSLRLLSEVGVEFPSLAARKVFLANDFKVTNDKVFIEPAQLAKALASAPSSFKVRARNPEHDLTLGGDAQVLAPTVGATQIAKPDGSFIAATYAHYCDLARLIQTSDFNMPMAHQVCSPQDLDPARAYLDMFWADITITDRVLTGNTSTPGQVRNFLQMLEMIFGGTTEVRTAPCSLNVINPCTPLKYADDQAESLLLLAAANQPIAITNMMMLGATAPISTPAALALGNAEILAGVVLAQLVSPGVPVIYGSTSCPMDMKSMVATLGAPESIWLSKGVQGLADFYNLPCRTGGALTDSHLLDAQAATDGALLLNNALSGGAHYILHSFGMMSSYMAVSFEKFLIDEEIASFILAAAKVPEVTEDSLNLGLIAEMGSSGGYLTHPSTVKGFRRLFRPKFINRGSIEQWQAKGAPSLLALAAEQVQGRLRRWEEPPLDAKLAAALKEFIKFAY